MDFRVHQGHLTDLRFQRNTVAGVCAVLLGVTLIQAIYLFFKTERIIITPPQLTQGFWVEGNRFSEQYLEEMALHFTHFLLDVSEKNIFYQGDILLRYVAPESYGTFKAKLLSEEKTLKKNSLSTRFYAVESKVIPEQLSVEMTGDLMSYVGDKRISQVRETYRLTFYAQSGRLMIKSFELVKSNRKEEKE